MDRPRVASSSRSRRSWAFRSSWSVSASRSVISCPSILTSSSKRWSDKIDVYGNQQHRCVRPSHMIRSRRLALAAAVVALGLAACGDPNTTTPVAERPPVIHLAGQSGGGFAPAPAAATAEAATDTKIAFGAPTDFVYDGDLPDLGSSAGSWFFDPNQQPDLDMTEWRSHRRSAGPDHRCDGHRPGLRAVADT